MDHTYFQVRNIFNDICRQLNKLSETLYFILFLFVFDKSLDLAELCLFFYSE